MPIFITASTDSAVATPSITAKAASLIRGMSTRFETKPGASLTATGFLPSFSQSCIVCANVSSLVCNPRITSTSTITGTGFMKCMPMNLSGRLVCAASVVIEMEEVLLASVTPGRSTSSALLSTRTFRSRFSGTASTAKSASLSAAISVTGSMRASAADFSASVIFAFFTSRSRFLVIVSSARSRNFFSTSRRSTR